jgi:riboflavin kinase/FMN adenylyltransferase
VEEGSVEIAARLLGRPFELTGVVVAGERVGRELGFPTINLHPESGQVVPGDGVYRCSCTTPFGTFAAAGSVGDRPTFEGSRRTVEAYLLDYPGDLLYGSAASLLFLAKIRDQERFADEEALKEQMARDVEAVRRS